MKPLNEKEYKKAFRQFTAMWVITTLLIVVVCLQMIKVPGKVNNEIGKELTTIHKVKHDQQSILNVIDSINLVLKEFQKTENPVTLSKIRKIDFQSIKDEVVKEKLTEFGNKTRATFSLMEEIKSGCLDDLQNEKKINKDRESEIRLLERQLADCCRN